MLIVTELAKKKICATLIMYINIGLVFEKRLNENIEVCTINF